MSSKLHENLQVSCLTQSACERGRLLQLHQSALASSCTLCLSVQLCEDTNVKMLQIYLSETSRRSLSPFLLNTANKSGQL